MTQPSEDPGSSAPGDARALAQEEEALAAEIEMFSAERVIFFTDAIAAIAITLLAFDLPVPHGSTGPDLLRWAGDHLGGYLAFVISFVVIGNYWRIHHRLFRFVGRLSPRAITLNLIWLFLLILMPFATRLLSTSGSGSSSSFGVRFGFYALLQVLMSSCLWLLVRVLSRDGLQRAQAPAGGSDLRLLALAAMFLVSIPVAFVTEYAYLLWIATPVVVRGTRRIQAWRRVRAAAAGPVRAG